MDDLRFFTFFLTVFQSYQADGQMIMKGCVQWNPVYGVKILPQVGLDLGATRSVGQHMKPTELPGLLKIKENSKMKSYLFSLQPLSPLPLPLYTARMTTESLPVVA